MGIQDDAREGLDSVKRTAERDADLQRARASAPILDRVAEFVDICQSHRLPTTPLFERSDRTAKPNPVTFHHSQVGEGWCVGMLGESGGSGSLELVISTGGRAWNHALKVRSAGRFSGSDVRTKGLPKGLSVVVDSDLRDVPSQQFDSQRQLAVAAVAQILNGATGNAVISVPYF